MLPGSARYVAGIKALGLERSAPGERSGMVADCRKLHLDDVAQYRQANQLGGILQLQLAHDVGVVHADRLGTDGKQGGNLYH